MNSKIKILLMMLLGFGFIKSYSQNEKTGKNLVLFTDRDYCISGDTVWFKVGLPGNLVEKGNVVRVQFETVSGNLISVVAKSAKNDWAEGYFKVPDSLSTGQCFVSAFLNSQRNEKDLKTIRKSLLVYNRFEDQVTKITTTSANSIIEKKEYNKFIEITTNKIFYSTREEVQFNLKFSSEIDLSNLVLKAVLLDPLSGEIGGDYLFNVQSSDSVIPDFVEQDGILIHGKVTDNADLFQPKVLVILSISGDPPYFDYYFTGEKGDFHFFLKNAFGKAKIVLQVITAEKNEYHIQLEKNYLKKKSNVMLQTKILTPGQSDFIGTVIQANFIRKLFYPVLSTEPDSFSIPNRFSVPFYGVPTRRVVPDEFIDLPDFREISREILPGLQYRVKNDEIIFRLINLKQNTFFEYEPIRLINGIPVFNNSLFADLKSTDISYIDIVQNERIYGDLRIGGVLSVSLNDKSNFWMSKVPGIYEFNVNCLQLDKTPEYLSFNNEKNNLPDFRQIYVWQKLSSEKMNNFNFRLSDLKGKVEISVEGFTKGSEVFKASKIIEVK